ncbi:DUF4249 domain-containing protein [Flavobacterium sp. PL002]|uniref:DUF4249 domain-containing protein n=1 Tax=Flavobacterium sp. PL002 TaxID=1897058 RepID=UPI0017888369|nr:DUF4249 domain-containing protein [Flavobacterium sp. PL002]MBE0391263.1 hypothetical protein [Flavobacterium sp. PL002]
MKKVNLAIILLFSFFMNSCEEVVQIDLDTEAPRLVIEANLKWQKGTDGSQQKIKLSTTTSFFSDQIPTVSGAEIIVKNSSNVPFIFTEIANTGEYECNNFIPVIDESYTLTVKLNDIIYSATETLKSVAPIDEVTQNNEGGIAKDQIQIKTFFNDPTATNYYLFQYTYEEERFQNLSATDDDFFQGNRFFSLSQKDDLEIGDKVTVTHYGVSKTYYNYLVILITISGGSSGGPFQSPPATVRGNIINTIDKDNYPLGFFSVGETDTRTITIQ